LLRNQQESEEYGGPEMLRHCHREIAARLTYPSTDKLANTEKWEDHDRTYIRMALYISPLKIHKDASDVEPK
jgi:hypothetical protein